MEILFHAHCIRNHIRHVGKICIAFPTKQLVDSNSSWRRHHPSHLEIVSRLQDAKAIMPNCSARSARRKC